MAETEDGDPLEVVGLSLPSVVERLASLGDPSKSAFSFVPPTASTEHIAAYVGQGIYQRTVEEGEASEGEASE